MAIQIWVFTAFSLVGPEKYALTSRGHADVEKMLLDPHFA